MPLKLVEGQISICCVHSREGGRPDIPGAGGALRLLGQEKTQPYSQFENGNPTPGTGRSKIRNPKSEIRN